MFTLSLITADANNIELSLAEEKFEELFGQSNKIELPLETEEEIQYVEDAIFELVSIMSLGIDTSFLLITDNENLRSRKLDDYDDLRFFIEESKSFNNLQGNPIISKEVPLRGNYWDIGDDYYFTRAETFASPNDIFDLHDFTYSVPQPLSKANPDVIETMDQAAFDNPIVPKSFGDRRGINQRTALDDAKDLIAKDRLASFGASFPYLNEERLLQDFDRLSRMDEVDDSDLINLLKFGYDEMKNLVGEPLKKAGEWGLGKVGGAIKKAFASKEDKMNKRAANAEAEKRALDAEKELAQTKKGDKADGKGDGDSQNSQSSQDAEAAYVADNLSDDARSRIDNLQRAESKVEDLETKAEKGADKVEGLKTRLENEKDPDKKAEIEDSIKQQEEKNKEIADKTTAAKEDLTKAADGAKAAEKEVEKLKQEAAEKVADKNIEKTKETKDSKDSKDSTEGEGADGEKSKEAEKPKDDEAKEKEKAERIKQKMDQVKQELKSAKYKSDDGVKKARTIAAGLRTTDPKAYAQVKADISKYVDKLEAKPRERGADARGRA